VTSLKQSVKQILICRQHKKYEKEVKSKNLSYDEWIKAQESMLGIDSSIAFNDEKSLTNDFLEQIYGGEKLENEGNHSEFDTSCRKMEV